MSAPYKQIVTIDFETYWDTKTNYTLSKITTEEYIRHERFKAFGACLHEFGTDKITQWYRADELPKILATYDWSTTAVLAHNAQFDVSILSWVYGIRPCFILDSLSMARALRGVEVGNSLARLAQAFGLPDKGNAVYNTNGVEELSWEMEKELADYCKHDVYLCEEIFKRLVDGYPPKELRLIDMTLRMYTHPVLELDANMLTDALHDEKEKREALLARLDLTDSVLASNAHFAEALRNVGIEPPTKKKKPTAKTPNPVGVNFAFAKTDAMFQAMLNGDNEDVAALCEARLKVKSTTERTRAQRFLDIAGRGTLPVPLSYYGAATGRWTASKGSAINMQNLKRGSFLRKAIMAPKGYQLVVGDLSQIEPRVLAWLSDYDELLRIFVSGGDPYAQFGAQMFNIPGLTKESHPDLRQSAKSALLGCFGADTLVLTNRGWIPIIGVQATDMVWDGEEWVCHQGVVPQGEKEVLWALGVAATADHEILTEHGWVEWSEALASLSLLQSALSLGNSLASAGNAALMDPSGKVGSLISPACGARADGKAWLKELTSVQDGQQDATTAPRRSPRLRAWLNKGLKRCAQTLRTESVCLTESARSLAGARTQATPFTQTMVVEASRCIRNGSAIALSSCATLLGWMAGIFQSTNSTASTTTKGTNQRTYASLQEASTCRTNARSKHVMSKPSSEEFMSLKKKMQTYDIAYAGPRNSYTILTSEGPMVVHNCGYGLGWASFASQLLVGFLGAPPVRYERKFAKALDVTAEDVEKFLDNEDYVKKMMEIPHICSTQELLIHCLAAKAIIEKYRKTAQPVVDFWNMCGQLIETSLYGGKEYTYKCLTFKKGEIVLPSGMSLLYPDLKRGKDEKGRVQWTYGEDSTKLYAGKITNNVTQGVARCVMTDGMLRVDKVYPVKGTVHDELIAVVPDAEVEHAKTWVLAQMTMEPRYMPGIPLDADGGAHRRYGLAKN